MNLNDLKENSVHIDPTNTNDTESGFIPREEPVNMSMSTGEIKPNRVQADMSSLPTEKVEGVIDKVSPVKEILEGGMFDEYRQASLQEYSKMKEKVLEEKYDSDKDNTEQTDEFDYDEEDDLVDTTPEEEDIDNDDEWSDDASLDVEDDPDEEGDIEYNQDDNKEESDDDEKRLITLKSIISEKISPIKKRLNLSSYTISKKVNTSSVIETNNNPKAKWVLMSSGVIVLMSSFSGSELEAIRSYIEDTENGKEDFRSVLNMVYNHIVSPKPKTFKEWVMSISFFDYENLFFAIYIASFNGVNYIPIECDSSRCPNKVRTYLTDNIPFMDMVEFKNDKIKSNFMEIYNSEVYDPVGLTISDIVPISERIAIGFKLPSLYDALIEPRYFNGEFLKKYNSTINVLPYIDNIYEIDNESKKLIPFAYKIYANNQAKSIRSRVTIYDSILKSFTPDEYNLIGGIVAEINDKRYRDYITYKIPKTECPYCGNIIEERKNQSPIQMVFTRNRLGTLATM